MVVVHHVEVEEEEEAEAEGDVVAISSSSSRTLEHSLQTGERRVTEKCTCIFFVVLVKVHDPHGHSSRSRNCTFPMLSPITTIWSVLSPDRSYPSR